MTDIDRLIELICDKIQDGHCIGYCNHPPCSRCKNIADYLVANGVICPSCKVGQIVWLVRDGIIKETTVEKIVLKDKGLYLKLMCNSFYETTCRSIGKTVFLTKEEADEELK